MSTVPDPTKVMGRRVIATLIDGALVIVPAALIASSQFQYLGRDELGGLSQTSYCDRYVDQVGGVCFAAGDRVYFDNGGAGPSVTLFGLAIIMFVVLQGLTGWTIGKLVTGIRTVREDGRPAGILKCLVRWLMWIVDGLPFAGLVGFIVGLTTTGHRRVGDMVAKTFVIRSTAAGRPVQVPGLTAPPAVPAADGTGWTTPGPATAPPTAKHGPQWDEARGTYIQWDPAQAAWMQWDEAAQVWNRMPGQAGDPPPPPPPPPPPAVT